MPYVKNVWVDEVLAGDARYDIKEDGGAAFKSTMRVELATGVTQAGTSVEVSKMNNIEDGIESVNLLMESMRLGAAMGHFMGLPVLRGFWPMTGGSMNNTVNDFSLNAVQLSQTGSNTFGLLNNLVPYRSLLGVGPMTAVNPFPLRITGTSAWNSLEISQGLTLGCWIRQKASVGATSRGIISKYDSLINQRSYLFYLAGTTGLPKFDISIDGSTSINSVTAAAALTLNQWYFLVGRFSRTTSIDVFTNNVKATVTTSITAGPLFASSADFYIGAYNAGAATTLLTADVAFAFILDGALSDAALTKLYNLTRPLFGL